MMNSKMHISTIELPQPPAVTSAPIAENRLLPAGMGGLVVLSLFDGMSCGQLALQKAGIKVKQYYAAEIDKYAIQVTMANYPDTIQLGDVTKVFAKDLPKIDLIIGGSPCQGFSFAGKGLNFEDPRSKLFFEFVRLVNECKPKYFLLENVKMKKEHELVISQYMKVAPIEINSALLSAQNRTRLYWTNINQKAVGLFGDMITDIPQPKDKGILLKDVLESDVPDKYFLSDKMLNYLNTRKANYNNGKINYKTENDVASCINASSGSIDISENIIIDTNRKSRCFTAGGNSGGLHSQMDLIKVGCVKFGRTDEAKEIRKESMKNGKDYTPFQAKKITGIDYEKMNTLTTVGNKDNLVIQLNPSTESNGCQHYQQNRIYDTDGISPALMAQMSCGTHAILDKSPCLHGFEYGTNGQFNRQLGTGGMIRRLTPTECERLQTVPDNEIICIFALCLDQVKNYVSAVEQNPKLLKLALSAEKEKLNEFVKLANQNTKQNNQQTKCIVQQGVDMMTQRQINQCTKINQKENNTTVNNAENIVMRKSQNQEAASALPNAFINITEGRIMHFGTEELHRNDSHSTSYLNGKKPLVLFGSEIMELVKDVDAGMKKNSDMIFTSTTLSALSISSLEQMLATYYLFAKNAITGYIPITTNQKSLSVQFQINDGYTSIVSDTQRYRMLGNGWTVDVIAYIFGFMKSELAGSAEW